MAFQSQDNRGKMSIIESMGKLCLSDKLADVTFLVGSDKFRAHRVVLSMRSPVFEAMLYGSLSETPGCEIRIEDTDIKTFRQFLWFVYTDDITLNGDSVLKVLHLANKYNLGILEDKCSSFLKTSMNVDNVCTIYEHAGAFSQHELQRSCFEFITDNAAGVLRSRNLLAISKETLGTILSSDNLSVDEKSVYDAAFCWAKHRCRKSKVAEDGPNIRHELGNLLFSIRFPLIPMDVFAKEICPAQVLTAEEENIVFRYIATTEATDKSTRTKVGKFLANTRKGRYFVFTIEDSKVQVANIARSQKIQSTTLNISPVQTENAQINIENVKLHKIKCRKHCPVSNIQSVQEASSRPRDAYNEYSSDFSFSSNDKDLFSANPSRHASNLRFEIHATENTFAIQPPLAVKDGISIGVYFKNRVSVQLFKCETKYVKNGLNLQISPNQNMFDELIFLR